MRYFALASENEWIEVDAAENRSSRPIQRARISKDNLVQVTVFTLPLESLKELITLMEKPC